MMKHVKSLLLLLYFCTGGGNWALADEIGGGKLPFLYKTLDSLIACQNNLVADKEQRITVIRDGLKDPTLSFGERYKVQERMYDEYLAYQYDSAFHYIKANIELAQRMNDLHREYQSMLRMTHILSVTGLFDKAHRVLNDIKTELLTDEERTEYFYQQMDLSLFESEFATGTPFFQGYQDSAMAYRERIMRLAPHDTYTYIFTKSTYICEKGQFKEAIRLLKSYLPNVQPGNRHYSIITSTLSYFHARLGMPEQKEYYLLLSAISDLRGSIRENNSLRELAMIQFDKGDYDRAFLYMNTAVADALFYGTKLRSVQASQMAPRIVKAYHQVQAEKRRMTMIWLVLVSVIALSLIAALLYILRLLRKQREAQGYISLMNDKLHESVKNLERASSQMTESNKVKDEYLGRLLALCSHYIDRADEQRKLENRLARDHKLPELYAELKSNKFISESMALFYQSFDTAFLNVYPSFVDEVNKLLEPQHRIVPKEEKLTTELRILALIRLGITDNQKISDILRSSITTVYTYRSKLKAKSKLKDSFEDSVKLIEYYE